MLEQKTIISMISNCTGSTFITGLTCFKEGSRLSSEHGLGHEPWLNSGVFFVFGTKPPSPCTVNGIPLLYSLAANFLINWAEDIDIQGHPWFQLWRTPSALLPIPQTYKGSYFTCYERTECHKGFPLFLPQRVF